LLPQRDKLSTAIANGSLSALVKQTPVDNQLAIIDCFKQKLEHIPSTEHSI
jgi:hypothetical protein